MRIGILTGSVSRRAGGIFEALCSLSIALRDQQGADVRVFGLIDDATTEDMPNWRGLPIHAAQVAGPRAFGYAADLYQAVRDAHLDVLHITGSWMYPTLVSLRWGRATGRAIVLSPQGNIDPWALSNSRWKKKMAMALFEMRHLRRAACLHAVSESEAYSLRSLGLTNPICIIPNGVNIPRTEDSGGWQPAWAQKVPKNAKVLLFLGRLHQKKNIGALLDAWRSVCVKYGSARDWWLVIGGPDQGGYQEELRQQVELLQAQRVLFVGPQYGADKDACFRGATAFILPSLSEGLPIAVLEAWSYGLPVVITPECNLPEGVQSGAAIEANTTVSGIEQALRTLLTATEGDLTKMGQAGLRLVASRFAWDRIASEMMAVYRWVANGGRPPRSVKQVSSECQR